MTVLACPIRAQTLCAADGQASQRVPTCLSIMKPRGEIALLGRRIALLHSCSGLATDSFMIQTLFGSTEEKPSFLQRMKEAVTRTRETLSERIEEVVGIRKEIDRDT